MNYFVDPLGTFKVKLPPGWRYMNIEAGYEEKSPFSFQNQDDPRGALQISCYSDLKKLKVAPQNIQQYNTAELEFAPHRMDDPEHKMHLWYATVQDNLLMVKYIYDAARENDPLIVEDLATVGLILRTIEVISPDRRNETAAYAKFQDFIISLAASYDIKYRALENNSFVEFIAITANQIDAFLRMSLMLKKQLETKTESVDTKLVFQGDLDQPIMERSIYKQALTEKIIDTILFDQLELLYKRRNVVIHRYIISNFKTRELAKIALEYEEAHETTRLVLKEMEERQKNENVGIYGRDAIVDPTSLELSYLHTRVNEKHLWDKLERKLIENSTGK